MPAPAATEIYTLSLHDALPISIGRVRRRSLVALADDAAGHRHELRDDLAAAGALGHRRRPRRSEEHTSELQSRLQLVCRLLPEKTTPTPTPLMTAQTTPPSSSS